MEQVIVFLGTAHRLREPGKHSPDGRLQECIYSREIVKEVSARLHKMGIRTMTDLEQLDLPKTMQSPSSRVERQRELALRVNLVNEVCRQEGKQNVIYVSIHVNAAASDNLWHKPNGWQVCVGTKAGTNSKILAGCIFDAAGTHELNMRRPTPTQKYWEQNLYVLNHTLCPAVLTENLFQDNIDDVDFLISDEGRDIIADLHVQGIIKFLRNHG